MLTATTNLLELLKEGGSVTLPNQVILNGDNVNGYIDIGYLDSDCTFVSQGLWELSESGFNSAITDSESISENMMF